MGGGLYYTPSGGVRHDDATCKIQDYLYDDTIMYYLYYIHYNYLVGTVCTNQPNTLAGTVPNLAPNGKSTVVPGTESTLILYIIIDFGFLSCMMDSII